MKHRRWKNVT